MNHLAEITGMIPFFLKKIKNIVDAEEALKTYKLEDLDYDTMKFYKKMGFSDKGMSELFGCEFMDVISAVWSLE